MTPFLRQTGIIYNPGLDWTFLTHRRPDVASHGSQYRLIAPGRIGYHVMQRLMHPPHVVRRQAGCHWLHALAFSWQQQPCAIQLQRHRPVGVPRGLHQAIHISREAFLLRARRTLFAHKTNLYEIVLFITQ